jgi:hypothetical protein
MQGDCQFDDPETGSKVATRHGDGIDRLGTQLVGKLIELLFVEPPKIGRMLDSVEKGGCHDPNNILATGNPDSFSFSL